MFGRGLAIVPVLQQGVVQQFGWLTEHQFLDAVAVAMITPGPVVITVAFIGFLVAGMAGAVLSEASLSFLGLGIPPPAPSWGTMIEEARQFFSSSPHVLFFPGLAIALTVLAFNFIGDGLREYLDPKQRAR